MSDDFMESSISYDAQSSLLPQAEESTDGCQRSHDRGHYDTRTTRRSNQRLS